MEYGESQDDRNGPCHKAEQARQNNWDLFMQIWVSSEKSRWKSFCLCLKDLDIIFQDLFIHADI